VLEEDALCRRITIIGHLDDKRWNRCIVMHLSEGI